MLDAIMTSAVGCRRISVWPNKQTGFVHQLCGPLIGLLVALVVGGSTAVGGVSLWCSRTCSRVMFGANGKRSALPK
jgi:hypothetical protein